MELNMGIICKNAYIGLYHKDKNIYKYNIKIRIYQVKLCFTASSYNFTPFEINCTLNLKAIFSSLVSSTYFIFDI